MSNSRSAAEIVKTFLVLEAASFFSETLRLLPVHFIVLALATLTASPAPAADEGTPSSGGVVIYTKDTYLHDSKDWFHEGYADQPWVKQLWTQYRPLCPAPTDGWKQKHDDPYYLNAIEKQRKK